MLDHTPRNEIGPAHPAGPIFLHPPQTRRRVIGSLSAFHRKVIGSSISASTDICTYASAIDDLFRLGLASRKARERKPTATPSNAGKPTATPPEPTEPGEEGGETDFE